MNEKHLHIIWANGDPVTSEHMVLMYATNSMLKGWWEKVTVIIWGAPAKLVTENEAIKLKMELATQAGVHFSACISCAINLGTREKLSDMGIEVIPWGQPLTELLQSGAPIISV